MTTKAGRYRATSLALLSLLVVVAGVVGYFLAVLRFGGLFPNVRNNPIGPWVLVAAGVVLSALAVRRAHGRRLVPALVLGSNLLLAGLFASFLYVVLRVPATPGPAVGSRAVDFALADQTGRMHRLADYAGKPLLLVFYRGHW
jgi:hypothetical protein